MMKGQIHNRPYLIPIRKNLRNSATSAETLLWQALKNSKLEDRKFRRQHSINDYVVDFYCPAEKLILEVDGDVHDLEEVKERDENREKELRDMGFNVLRIQNDDVFRNMSLVLLEIIKQFR